MFDLRMPEMQQVVLEKVKIAFQHRLSEEMMFVRNHMEVNSFLDNYTRSLVIQLSSYVLAGPERKRIDVEKQWPADWWQAFKERWFPKRWLRRWPVKYERVSIHEVLVTRMCPHVNVKTDNRPHFAFLMEKDS
jgi:hypothetical protein